MSEREERGKIDETYLGIKPLPANLLEAYVRGNSLWPQKHFATSVLVAFESLLREPLASLPSYQFSPAQLTMVAIAMNRLHTFNRVNRTYPLGREIQKSSSIKTSELDYLWDRSIFGAANRVITIGKLLPNLASRFRDIPSLRDLYYKEREKTLPFLGSIDILLQEEKEEAQIIRDILERMKFHLLDKDLSDLAMMYRMSIAEARREGKVLLVVREEEISKEDFVLRASSQLIEKLKNDFPDLDWSVFDHGH